MLFLWVFGDNVEDALGHIRFLIFYLPAPSPAPSLHGMIGAGFAGAADRRIGRHRRHHRRLSDPASRA